MDSNIIVAFIGVLGVLAGAVLGGIGFLLKSRSEAKKILNHNIFNLFQIWHIVNILDKFDSDKFSSLYLARAKKLISDKPLTEEQDQELHQYCSRNFNEFMMTFLKSIKIDFKKRYLDGVLELSKVSPVLSYELSNNIYIKDLLDFIESFNNHTLKQKSKDNTITQFEGFHDGLQAGIQNSKKWVTKDFSRDLQKDICKLAFCVFRRIPSTDSD